MWYFLVPYSDEIGGGQWPVCNCSQPCEKQMWAQELSILVSLICFWPFEVWTVTVFFLLVSWMPMCFTDVMIEFWRQALTIWLSRCLSSVSNIWVFLWKPKLAVTHQLFWLTKKIPRDYFTTPGTPEQMGHHRFLDPPQARPLTPIPLSLFPPYLPGYPGQKQQRASWLLPLLYFCLKHVQSVTKSYQFYPLRIFDCYCLISFLHYFLPGLLYFLSSS